MRERKKWRDGRGGSHSSSRLSPFFDKQVTAGRARRVQNFGAISHVNFKTFAFSSSVQTTASFYEAIMTLSSASGVTSLSLPSGPNQLWDSAKPLGALSGQNSGGCVPSTIHLHRVPVEVSSPYTQSGCSASRRGNYATGCLKIQILEYKVIGMFSSRSRWHEASD